MDYPLFPYRHKFPLTLVKNQNGFYYVLILFNIRVSGLFFTICAFVFALAFLFLKFYIFSKGSFGATKLQQIKLNYFIKGPKIRL